MIGVIILLVALVNIYFIFKSKNIVSFFVSLYLCHFYLRYFILTFMPIEYFYIKYVGEIPNQNLLDTIMIIFTFAHLALNLFLKYLPKIVKEKVGMSAGSGTYKSYFSKGLDSQYVDAERNSRVSVGKLFGFVLIAAAVILVIYVFTNVTRVSDGSTNYFVMIISLFPMDILVYYCIYVAVKNMHRLKTRYMLLLLALIMVNMIKSLLIGVKSPPIITLFVIAFFMIKYKRLKLNVFTILLAIIAVVLATELYKIAASGDFKFDYSIKDTFNIALYASRRVAGLDSVYLIVSKAGSLPVADYFTPARFFAEIYRSVVPNSLYIPIHYMDKFSLGRVFYIIYTNGDPTRSMGMEPSLLGLTIACFGSVLGVLLFVLCIFGILMIGKRIKNDFLNFAVGFQFLFLLISGSFDAFFPSIMAVIVFAIIINVFNFNVDKKDILEKNIKRRAEINDKANSRYIKNKKGNIIGGGTEELMFHSIYVKTK